MYKSNSKVTFVFKFNLGSSSSSSSSKRWDYCGISVKALQDHVTIQKYKTRAKKIRSVELRRIDPTQLATPTSKLTTVNWVIVMLISTV